MTEFPKMLYRDGSRFIWLGKQLDTRIVESAVEQEEAFADGWHEDPWNAPEAPPLRRPVGHRPTQGRVGHRPTQSRARK